MANPSKLFDNEMSYKILMQIANNGLENGCLNEEEVKVMQRHWLEKYNPKISKLELDNNAF